MISNVLKNILVYLSFLGPALIYIDAFYAINIIISIITTYLIINGSKINWFIFFFILGNYAVAFYFLFSHAVGNSIDNQILLLYLKSGFFITVSIFWVNFYQISLENFLENQFVKSLIFSNLFSCLLVLGMLLMADFRMWIYSISSLYMVEKYKYAAEFTRVIDPSIGGSSFGFMLCITFLIFELSVISKKIKYNIVWRYFIRLVVIATLAVTARSGLVLYFLLLLALCVRYRSIDLLCFCLSISMAGSVAISMIELTAASAIASWILEAFIDPLNSPTLKYLLKSYYLPADLKIYMFGGSEYPGKTDSILIKLLYGVGIPIVLVGIILPSMLILIRCNFSTVLDQYTITLVNLVFVIMIIANLKESLWSNSRGAGLLAVLLINLFGTFSFKAWSK